jgi:hypothetical protein
MHNFHLKASFHRSRVRRQKTSPSPTSYFGLLYPLTFPPFDPEPVGDGFCW